MKNLLVVSPGEKEALSLSHLGQQLTGPVADSSGSRGLSIRMEPKLDTGLALASLRTRLDFPRGGTDGDGQRKPRGRFLTE